MTAHDGGTRPPQHLADLDIPARRAWMTEIGEKPMRAIQLSHHYFSHLTRDPEAMTDLPAADRGRLSAIVLPELAIPRERRVADAGATIKELLILIGGARIETVLMAYPDRVTVCVSTQAGCGMGCPFCATGQAGLVRNLTAGEIVEQVWRAARVAREGELAGGAARLSNVVFMGMGEPLANYEATVRALRAIAAEPPAGLGISARNLTVSTCGIVPGMERLAGEGMPVRLAISLHAPDDELRDTLVPVNKRFPVANVLDAARAYTEASGRRISIEYALIRDINDQEWRADLLARLLLERGQNWAHVNPIPLNDTPGTRWTASTPHTSAAFVERLRAAGIVTTIRETRGADIDGACGQLAAKEWKEHG